MKWMGKVIVIVIVFVCFCFSGLFSCGFYCPSGTKDIPEEIKTLLGPEWTKWVISRVDEIEYTTEENLLKEVGAGGKDYYGLATVEFCVKCEHTMCSTCCYRKILIDKQQPPFIIALVLIHEAAHHSTPERENCNLASEKQALETEWRWTFGYPPP